MRNDTWIAAFDHELQARGVGAADRAEAVVEVESFLFEARAAAVEQFGPPAVYAAQVATALAPAPPAPRPDAPVVLSAEGLRKAYRGVPVLDGMDLAATAGQVVALVGTNGAGKSTLLRLLAGLEEPDAGRIAVSGRVGYVPQSGGLDPYLRPTEHFALFGRASGLSKPSACAEGLRLARQLGWDAAGAPISSKLSGGTRQKLSVVLAMLGDPAVLLLDEPYQGMDAPSTARFWELLWTTCERGSAAIVSSHSSEVLVRADLVVELPEPATGGRRVRQAR